MIWIFWRRIFAPVSVVFQSATTLSAPVSEVCSIIINTDLDILKTYLCSSISISISNNFIRTSFGSLQVFVTRERYGGVAERKTSGWAQDGRKSAGLRYGGVAGRETAVWAQDGRKSAGLGYGCVAERETSGWAKDGRKSSGLRYGGVAGRETAVWAQDGRESAGLGYVTNCSQGI